MHLLNVKVNLLNVKWHLPNVKVVENFASLPPTLKAIT